MPFANVLPNGLSIQYLSRVDARFMQDTDGGFTSRVKGVGGAAGKCHVTAQAQVTALRQVSSDLHSVDASLFTSLDVQENTLDLRRVAATTLASSVHANSPNVN